MNFHKSRRHKRMQRKLNYKNKILSILLISVMVFGMIPMQAYSTVDTSNSDNVEIKDKNLEKALKEEIKEINPDYNDEVITKEDIKLIVDIDLSNKGIKSLEGIENAENLKSINLEGNEITDVSPLGEIDNLENANISNQKIKIKEIKNLSEELIISNPLIGFNKETISNINGESLEVIDKSIKLKGISESNLVEINFNEIYENKIFSGKIILNLIIENKEDKSIQNEEKVESNEDIDPLNKKELTSKDELSRDLISSFHISGKSSSYGGDNFSVKDSEVVQLSGNSIRVGNEKIAKDPERVQQSAMATSKYQLDFNKSFRLKGTLKMKSSPDGIAITFHDKPNLEVDRTGSSIGVYSSKNNGLKNAIVLEIDSASNRSSDVGDWGIENKHIAISEIDERYNNGNANVFDIKEITEYDFDEINGKIIEITWNSRTMILKLEYNGKVVKHKFADADLIYQFGKDKKAYISLSGAVNFGSGAGGNIIEISMENLTNRGIINEIKVRGFYNYFNLLIDGDNKKIVKNYDDVNNVRDEGQLHSNLTEKNYFTLTLYTKNRSSIKYRKIVKGRDKVQEVFNNEEIEFEFGDIIQFSHYEDHKFGIRGLVKNNSLDYEADIENTDGGLSKKLTNKYFRITPEGLEEIQGIVIPDVNLKNRIEETLDPGNLNFVEDINSKDITIFQEDLEKLEDLSFVDVSKKPTNLTNLKYAKNLSTLKLDGSTSIDLDIAKREIEQLSNLIDLSYRGIGVTDINKLPNMPTIGILDLGINNIDNIAGFEERYPNLKTLIMDNNKISDLRSLSGLLDLKVLNLNNNQISDVTPMGNLNNLNEFYLDNNKISDLRPIKEQIEKAKSNTNKYSIKKQVVAVERKYINSGEFIFNNIIYNSNEIENNVMGADEYDFSNDQLKWSNLSNGEQKISYDWMNNQFMFSGTVNIELNQVITPDYLVTIPSSLNMGNVLDEKSKEYDPEIDKTSINYNPQKEVNKKNPIVYGMVGAKNIISIVSDDAIIGDVNIYTDSVFTMKNSENNKDTVLVDVYKTFDEKLTGTAMSKSDKLMSLNDNNRKNVFRIKAPTSRFKDNNAEYKGTMNFIIEHVK
ncbi:leucine-rich repeat domain-containing protein [Clostridium perfringens]|uniref:leucine-rich repeat domain-containing protein n=1 Tax=Clostridium perfringens TaxID=1502 RepID=UPI001CC927D3|nr:leucine-rich repeat domain-containing protein [Clostridium perfringens]UBK98055.1 leucine-rich repeat domain-containing protein [Clostridium perfringens]